MEEKEQIIENVKVLLEKYPGFRKPETRKDAHWTYWQEFQDVGNFGVLKKQYLNKLVSPEVIGKIIDKLSEIKQKVEDN